MRVKVLAAAVAALSGCATPETVFVDRPVEHRTEVSRPCLAPGDIPAAREYATDRLAPGSADGDVILALLEEITERSADQDVLTALLRGCTQ